MKRMSLVILMTLSALVTGCAKAEYSKLKTGECLPASADVVGRREADPTRVPCSVAHRYEVYDVGSVEIDGKVPGRSAEYPGDDVVDAASKAQCVRRFAAGVGVEPADLPDGVKMVYVAPTEQSWNDTADRDVECLVVFDDDHTGAFIEQKEM